MDSTIVEVKKYTNEEGKVVTEHIPVNAAEDGTIQKSRFEGGVGVKSPMGVIPLNFDFPEDFTLDDCFLKFEEIADTALQAMMEKAQDEQRILTPDQIAQQQGGNTIQFPG